jgi:DNA-binding XRE family transcriptional regulator
MAPRSKDLYFIQAAKVDLIKIGSSFNAVRRTEGFQVGSPVALRLIGVIEGAGTSERELHRRFAAAHAHGEWFHATPELLAYVAEHARPARSKTERVEPSRDPTEAAKPFAWRDLARKRRRFLELTCAEVADAIGVGEPTLWRWETGKGPQPRVHQFEAWAAAIKVDPVALLAAKEEDAMVIAMAPDSEPATPRGAA